MERNYRFSTARLLVDEWHSLTPAEWPAQNLAAVVQQVMTETVTKTLPPPWQGPYAIERAQQWIDERDAEGTTLLAIEQTSAQPVGLTVLFEPDFNGHIRLGYMLAESAWGKGFATELINGLVSWCRENAIKSITGGVEHNNPASARVLEKCGFSADDNATDDEQVFYSIRFV